MERGVKGGEGSWGEGECQDVCMSSQSKSNQISVYRFSDLSFSALARTLVYGSCELT